MSSRSNRIATAGRTSAQQPSAQPSNASDDGDRALAEIRAWTQLLVARGNRLREVAEREREALHAGTRKRAGSHAKPLA